MLSYWRRSKAGRSGGGGTFSDLVHSGSVLTGLPSLPMLQSFKLMSLDPEEEMGCRFATDDFFPSF